MACAKMPKARPLQIEFLVRRFHSERIFGLIRRRLKELGIDAWMRRVDATQEQERLRRYDFDIVTQRYALGATPGPEVRAFWSSDAGREDGSYNLAGIADPVVDALIGNFLNAKSRDELRTAAHALDRVLRAGHYWVPEWYLPVHRSPPGTNIHTLQCRLNTTMEFSIPGGTTKIKRQSLAVE